MKPSLYLETTILSFLVGGVSPVLVTAAHQAATRQWWQERRNDYRLYVSSVVDEEIGRGTGVWLRERQQLIADLPRLAVTDEVLQLADELFAHLRLPPGAWFDALHLAVSCHHEMDYLLTWNLKHIASGHVRRALTSFHDQRGIAVPTICTPDELSDWEDVV